MPRIKTNLDRARNENLGDEMMTHDLADLLDSAELDLEGDYS